MEVLLLINNLSGMIHKWIAKHSISFFILLHTFKYQNICCIYEQTYVTATGVMFPYTSGIFSNSLWNSHTKSYWKSVILMRCTDSVPKCSTCSYVLTISDSLLCFEKLSSYFIQSNVWSKQSIYCDLYDIKLVGSVCF